MSFNNKREKGSRPIGVIQAPGTEYHLQTVYLSSEKPTEGKEGKEREEKKKPAFFGETHPALDTTDFFRQGSREGRKIKNGDIALVDRILQEIEDEAPEGEEDLSELAERPDVKAYVEKRLQEAKAVMKSRTRDFFLDPPAWILPLCDDTSRECCFIVGKSKSGKSTFAAWKVRSYRQKFPDNPIYLIVSPRVEGDPVFKDISGITRVTLDQKFIDQVNKDELALNNCLVIFDDVDSIADKKLKEAIWKLRAQLLETGRHGSVYVVNTSHIFRAGKATSAANNEATSIVMFPTSGEKYHIKDYLKAYCGMDASQIQRVMDLSSRWVEVVNQAPAYVLHERGAFFL